MNHGSDSQKKGYHYSIYLWLSIWLTWQLSCFTTACMPHKMWIWLWLWNLIQVLNRFSYINSSLYYFAWADQREKVCLHIAQLRCEECYMKTGSQYSTVGRGHSINCKQNPWKCISISDGDSDDLLFGEENQPTSQREREEWLCHWTFWKTPGP